MWSLGVVVGDGAGKLGGLLTRARLASSNAMCAGALMEGTRSMVPNGTVTVTARGVWWRTKQANSVEWARFFML